MLIARSQLNTFYSTSRALWILHLTAGCCSPCSANAAWRHRFSCARFSVLLTSFSLLCNFCSSCLRKALHPISKLPETPLREFHIRQKHTWFLIVVVSNVQQNALRPGIGRMCALSVGSLPCRTPRQRTRGRCFKGKAAKDSQVIERWER